MPWAQTANLQEFKDLCISVHPVYADQTVSGLQNIRDNRQGQFWIFTESTYKLIICLSFTDNIGHIEVMSPIGDYNPTVALKQSWTKVRQLMDAKGVDAFYGSPMDDYGSVKLNSFYQEIREQCWELEEGHENSRKSNDFFTFNFKRKTSRKNEDSQFSGPSKKGKPISVKRGRIT